MKKWLNFVNEIKWYTKPKIEVDSKGNNHKWFPDGYLNIYYNCIEKFLQKKKDKIVIYTIDNKLNLKKYTYSEINHLVNLFCNFINFHIDKINSKTKVMVHSSAGIESAISMLGCAKLGIEFSVIFEELEKIAIEKRIKLFKPDLFITRKNIKEVKFLKKFMKKNVFSFTHLNNFENKNFFYKTKKINSTKNLFTLFTSGSTGIPKGVVHSNGGYLLYSKLTCKIKFGMNTKSTVLTASDAGWINGHTYSLFGPLSCGSKIILLQSPLLMLNTEIYKILRKINTNVIYLPVTLIRFMRETFQNKKIKMKSLKCVGSMGEPLAKSVGDWLNNFFYREKKAIVNTYFQTETGGIIASPQHNSGIKEFPNGSVGNTLNQLVKLNKLNNNKREILITKIWPGCMKKILNDKKTYNSYWTREGYFRMYDLGTKINGNIYVHGRTDDVINIRGHRIGSGEVESIILQNKNVKECCAVSLEEKLEGNSLTIFIVSKNRKISDKINRDLIENFGSFAIPKKIFFVNELPKTRSGKILRRLLREILVNKDKNFSDLSTIQNKKSIKDIIKIINKNE
tara:strand:+ start:5419 stop:7119 length:1701 start_codon:yes stop_codon:yes gene_type:complete